jgi:hypothetical protein
MKYCTTKIIYKHSLERTVAMYKLCQKSGRLPVKFGISSEYTVFQTQTFPDIFGHATDCNEKRQAVVRLVGGYGVAWLLVSQ